MPRLSKEPFIHPDCAIKNSTFGEFVEIGQGTRLENVSLGDYSYTDRYSDIANAKIGKFANIAAFTRIGPTDHPWHKASQHHFLYRSQDYFEESSVDSDWFAVRESRVLTFGHDVWVGHGAVIKPEVTLGNGSIVASSAVVTKDVAPYMIVTGIPAEPLRPRFSDKTMADMESLAWWNWDHEQLQTALPDFRAMKAEDFLSKYLG